MRDIIAVNRVQRREYRETDVHSLLIGARYVTRNPVIKEFADLYAHRDRDKGIVAKRAFLHWAQMEMFTLYKSDEKIQFLKDNICDWWLREYLLLCIDRHTGGTLRKNLNSSAKGIRREVKGFFPDQEFPTQLQSEIDARLIQITQFFSNYIVVDKILDSNKTTKAAEELLRSFGIEGIDQDLIDGVSICLLLLFQGSSISLNKTLDISLQMSLEGYPGRSDYRGPGDISISSSFFNKFGDGLINLSSPLVGYFIKSPTILNYLEEFRGNLKENQMDSITIGFDTMRTNPFHA